MKSKLGKRRASVNSRDLESNHVGNSSTSGRIVDVTLTNSGGGGGGGIDSFLHRLNEDEDLKEMKKRALSDGIGEIGDVRRRGYVESGGLPGERLHQSPPRPPPSSSSLPKRVAKAVLSLFALGLLYDTIASPPEKRLLGSHRIHDFLFWVKENPGTGAAAFVFVYGMCVVLLLPGTPLTLGGGYVYKVAYGWVGGVAMTTLTSMAGSLVGSCSCFVMGRYVMRDRVRRWGRRYPLFDAIDVAVSDNGFKIMCLLYLTPILPLGPVSYMCGTTSMPLIKFAGAKIAALPLMLLYAFIGASTDTFFSAAGDDHVKESEESETGGSQHAVKKVHGVDLETHRKMVLFGLCLSVVSMSLVSHFVKKELYKIFDKQKKEKGRREECSEPDAPIDVRGHVAIVGRKEKLLRRLRGHAVERSDSNMLDEEVG